MGGGGVVPSLTGRGGSVRGYRGGRSRPILNCRRGQLHMEVSGRGHGHRLVAVATTLGWTVVLELWVWSCI